MSYDLISWVYSLACGQYSAICNSHFDVNVHSRWALCILNLVHKDEASECIT